MSVIYLIMVLFPLDSYIGVSKTLNPSTIVEGKRKPDFNNKGVFLEHIVLYIQKQQIT